MRKEADLHIADRIRLSISGAEEILAAHKDYIMSETLCVEVLPEQGQTLIERSITLDGASVKVTLAKA
jgi:hypothetical protein